MSVFVIFYATLSDIFDDDVVIVPSKL